MRHEVDISWRGEEYRVTFEYSEENGSTWYDLVSISPESRELEDSEAWIDLVKDEVPIDSYDPDAEFELKGDR